MQQEAVLTCIYTLKQYQDLANIVQHGVVLLERLEYLNSRWKDHSLERSDILQLVMNLDQDLAKHSTWSTSLSSPTNPLTDTDDGRFMEQLIRDGFDSGSVLDDYFISQDQWKYYTDEFSFPVTNPSIDLDAGWRSILSEQFSL